MKFVLLPFLLGAAILLAPQTTFARENFESAESVRETIADLLDELDDFKDTAEFRRCIYGCGQENPGWTWRNKLRRLQRWTARHKNIPLRYMDAIGELWQLGRVYARGNIRKAVELRHRIESTLK